MHHLHEGILEDKCLLIVEEVRLIEMDAIMIKGRYLKRDPSPSSLYATRN
jgi:hypothetical protein